MDSGQQGVTSKQIGANISISLGEFGDQLVSELQARYYEQIYRGNVFTVQYTAAALAAPSATVAVNASLHSTTLSHRERTWCCSMLLSRWRHSRPQSTQ